jgi:hypothetical protein
VRTELCGGFDSILCTIRNTMCLRKFAMWMERKRKRKSIKVVSASNVPPLVYSLVSCSPSFLGFPSLSSLGFPSLLGYHSPLGSLWVWQARHRGRCLRGRHLGCRIRILGWGAVRILWDGGWSWNFGTYCERVGTIRRMVHYAAVASFEAIWIFFEDDSIKPWVSIYIS